MESKALKIIDTVKIYQYNELLNILLQIL